MAGVGGRFISPFTTGETLSDSKQPDSGEDSLHIPIPDAALFNDSLDDDLNPDLLLEAKLPTETAATDEVQLNLNDSLGCEDMDETQLPLGDDGEPGVADGKADDSVKETNLNDSLCEEDMDETQLPLGESDERVDGAANLDDQLACQVDIAESQLPLDNDDTTNETLGATGTTVKETNLNDSLGCEEMDETQLPEGMELSNASTDGDKQPSPTTREGSLADIPQCDVTETNNSNDPDKPPSTTDLETETKNSSDNVSSESKPLPSSKAKSVPTASGVKVKPSFGKKKGFVAPKAKITAAQNTKSPEPATKKDGTGDKQDESKEDDGSEATTSKTSKTKSPGFVAPTAKADSPSKSSSSATETSLTDGSTDNVDGASVSNDDTSAITKPSKVKSSTGKSGKVKESEQKKAEKEVKKQEREEMKKEKLLKKQEMEKEKERKKAEKERQKEEKRLEQERKKAEREQKKMEKELKKLEQEKSKAEKHAAAAEKKKASGSKAKTKPETATEPSSADVEAASKKPSESEETNTEKTAPVKQNDTTENGSEGKDTSSTDEETPSKECDEVEKIGSEDVHVQDESKESKTCCQKSDCDKEQGSPGITSDFKPTSDSMQNESSTSPVDSKIESAPDCPTDKESCEKKVSPEVENKDDQNVSNTSTNATETSPEKQENEASNNKAENDTKNTAKTVTKQSASEPVEHKPKSAGQKKKFVPPSEKQQKSKKEKGAKKKVLESQTSNKPTKSSKKKSAPKEKPKQAPQITQPLVKKGKKRTHNITMESESEEESKPKRSKSANYSGPVWVQCENSDCKKWRQLKDCLDPALVPEKWVCSANTDENHNSCSAPEEQWSDLGDSQEFVESPFVPGSVVWAKMDGYPWWPAMIEEDPDDEAYYEMGDDGYSLVPVKYHVVFFDTIVCRAWVSAFYVTSFADQLSNPNKDVKVVQRLKRSLREATKQARKALGLDTKERLSQFGFAKRYQRNTRSRKRKNTSDDDECTHFTATTSRGRKSARLTKTSTAPSPDSSHPLATNQREEKTNVDHAAGQDGELVGKKLEDSDAATLLQTAEE